MLRPLNAATRAAHHAIGFTRAAPRRRRRAWGNSVGQQAQSPSRRTRLHLGRARPSEGWRRPAGRSCGSGCSRSAHLTYSATSDETAADLFVDPKLATDKTNASGRWNREDGYHLEPPPQKAPALVRRSPPPTRRRSDVQLHSASAENSHSESPRRLMIACNSATEPARTIPTATRRSRRAVRTGDGIRPKAPSATDEPTLILCQGLRAGPSPVSALSRWTTTTRLVVGRETAHRSSWVVPRPPPGEGQDCLPGPGPDADQPVPAVVRCREAATGRSPVEGLVYERPQRYLLVGAL